MLCCACVLAFRLTCFLFFDGWKERAKILWVMVVIITSRILKLAIHSNYIKTGTQSAFLGEGSCSLG